MASELRRGAFGGNAALLLCEPPFVGLDSSSRETSVGMELVLHSLRGRYLPCDGNTVVMFGVVVVWCGCVWVCVGGPRALSARAEGKGVMFSPV